jgi:hypothetical protein
VAVDYDEEGGGPSDPILPAKLGVFTTDGEAGQTQVINKDPEILALLDDAGVASNKHGAGGSLTQQAADLSPCFMSTKNSLKNASGVEFYNPALEMALSTALSGLKAEGVDMTPAMQEKYSRALQSIVAALSMHVSPANIKKGFARSGMTGDPDTWNEVTRKVPFAPPGGGRGQTTPYYKFTANDWSAINSKFDDMVKTYIKEGRLTDAYFDSIGMPRAASQDGVEKDDLVEYRWRSAWLNNKKVVELLKARASAKQAAAASAALASQVANQRKTNKGEASKILEEQILPLIAGLKTLFEEAEAATKQCAESVKAASEKKSEGKKDCEAAKKKAKDEEDNVHSLWAGGRTSGTEARAAVSDGNLEMIRTLVTSLTSTTTTAKASRDSAVSAAADAKTAAARPPALFLPPIPGTTKKGKGPKVPESADNIRAQLVKLQAALKAAEAAEAAEGDDDDPREEMETEQAATGGSGVPKRGRAEASSSSSPDPKARTGTSSRYGRPTGSGWGQL